MGLIKVEKKSQFWIGLLVLILSVLYVFSTLGRADLAVYVSIIFGYFLTIFLIVEAGVVDYFIKKEYRKVNFSDFVIWLTTITAGAILVNTTLLFQKLNDLSPEWLLTFSSTTGVIVGVTAGILAIIFMVTSKFK